VRLKCCCNVIAVLLHCGCSVVAVYNLNSQSSHWACINWNQEFAKLHSATKLQSPCNTPNWEILSAQIERLLNYTLQPYCNHTAPPQPHCNHAATILQHTWLGNTQRVDREAAKIHTAITLQALCNHTAATTLQHTWLMNKQCDNRETTKLYIRTKLPPRSNHIATTLPHV